MDGKTNSMCVSGKPYTMPSPVNQVEASFLLPSIIPYNANDHDNTRRHYFDDFRIIL